MSAYGELKRYAEQVKNGELNWMDDALCAQTDPDAFHPGHGELNLSKTAIKICNMCDVKEQCLDYALKNNESIGIWGGTGPRTRAKMRVQLGLSNGLRGRNKNVQ